MIDFSELTDDRVAAALARADEVIAEVVAEIEAGEASIRGIGEKGQSQSRATTERILPGISR